jgi:hypothetical protein
MDHPLKTMVAKGGPQPCCNYLACNHRNHAETIEKQSATTAQPSEKRVCNHATCLYRGGEMVAPLRAYTPITRAALRRLGAPTLRAQTSRDDQQATGKHRHSRQDLRGNGWERPQSALHNTNAAALTLADRITTRRSSPANPLTRLVTVPLAADLACSGTPLPHTRMLTRLETFGFEPERNRQPGKATVKSYGRRVFARALSRPLAFLEASGARGQAKRSRRNRFNPGDLASFSQIEGEWEKKIAGR